MSGPQQMALDPKEILHQAVGRGEPLELPDRLEAAQLSWVSSSTVSRRQGRLGDLDFVFESAFPASDTSYRVGLTTPSGSSPRNSASSSRAPFMMPSSA